MSRSTWACELKWHCDIWTCEKRQSRSTWACELKSSLLSIFAVSSRHAPRERVSWNSEYQKKIKAEGVTLHVSVWVEILKQIFYFHHVESRSTWACELKFNPVSEFLGYKKVTLHVSVWVEIAVLGEGRTPTAVTLHVSVWVEIVKRDKQTNSVLSHAPRERVSWNDLWRRAMQDESVTLHVSVWVEMFLWHFRRLF